MIDLSVIIVNYNTADFLHPCLNSVLSQDGVSFEVIVVDNASQDHSVDMVREYFPQIRLIASLENLGFSKANNLATTESSARFVFYLNPDTEVRPGCFKTMIRYMEKNSSVGMAGTSIVYPDNTKQGSVETKYPGQRHTGGTFACLPGKIAWLLGASLVVRRDVIREVEGFTEDYFLYGEDVDLGLKIRKAGYKLGFIEDATIIHWEGKSERDSQPNDVLLKKLVAEALFYRRHYTQESITKICMGNIYQARWRLFTLKFELLLNKNRQDCEKKIGKYRLIYSFFQKLAAEIRLT